VYRSQAEFVMEKKTEEEALGRTMYRTDQKRVANGR
jgi:hypothetical protein